MRNTYRGVIQAGVVLALFFSVCGLYADSRQEYENGQRLQAQGDWYGAIEQYQEALHENSANHFAHQRLAECFYALNEYEQALVHVKRAGVYKKQNPDLDNLHGFILIGLHRANEARTIFSDILKRYPNNLDARFGLAEIDISAGKLTDAAHLYEAALQRQQENRKALLSLALVSYEQGKTSVARQYIEQALEWHGDNPQVHYVAGFLDLLSNEYELAEGHLRAALRLDNRYDDARSLLAVVLYAQNRYAEVVRLADVRINHNRMRSEAWYIKAVAQLRLGQKEQALQTLERGGEVAPDDELMRALLEDTAVETLAFESPRRLELAKIHRVRGAELAVRNITGQALYEYRRALKVSPYDVESREAYAALLRRIGYPERYLEQLEFIQSIGKSTPAVNDAVESYGSIYRSSIKNRWNVDSLTLDKAHLSLGIYYTINSANVAHPDAEKIAARLLYDELSYNRRFDVQLYNSESVDYAAAFRRSRKAENDYFILLRLTENDRDIEVFLDVYVSATGAKAASFTVYRTGNDRWVHAVRRLGMVVAEKMPVIGTIINRYQNSAIIDIGSHDAMIEKAKFDVIRVNTVSVASEGIGLVYAPDNVYGSFTVTTVSEDISEGVLSRRGYFDRINKGDTVVLITADDHDGQEVEQNIPVRSAVSPLLYLLKKIR